MACRVASSNAFPKIWPPVTMTCTIIFGADLKYKQHERADYISGIQVVTDDKQNADHPEVTQFCG